MKKEARPPRLKPFTITWHLIEHGYEPAAIEPEALRDGDRYALLVHGVHGSYVDRFNDLDWLDDAYRWHQGVISAYFSGARLAEKDERGVRHLYLLHCSQEAASAWHDLAPHAPAVPEDDNPI
jgi:hypothetical protein